MSALPHDVLLDLIGGSAEPLLVARVDRPDWPVALSNAAFEQLANDTAHCGKPFADVVERLLGRELALEISESVRAQEKSTIPVEARGREFLLSVAPLADGGRYVAAYWRSASFGKPVNGATDAERALRKAKRRIRDLSRDDAVTGLWNGDAFRDVLQHDWAVAAREKTTLALVAFAVDDYQAYLDVFGRHAADSSLRRIGQVIRRCLRRASDVAARIEGDDGGHIVVLSHGSDEDNTRAFAVSIAAAVRELGLHHPRSRLSKFVTVSFDIALVSPGEQDGGANECLRALLTYCAVEEEPVAAEG